MTVRKESGKTLIALVPVVVLVVLLALDISIFGSDAILGASQVSLLFSAGICVWLSMWLYKTPWATFEEAIRSNVGDVTSAIVILLLIGALSGAWTVSGVVPTFIYYGLKIISPKIFLLSACVICALVSLMVGSLVLELKLPFLHRNYMPEDLWLCRNLQLISMYALETISTDTSSTFLCPQKYIVFLRTDFLFFSCNSFFPVFLFCKS